MAVNATTQIKLSGSTQGKGIKIVPTSTPGTTIHSTGTSGTDEDQVWLYLYNGHTSDVVVTLEYGGVTVPDNTIVLTVPFKQGLWTALAGLPLYGSGSVAATLAAFAATANVIVAYGYVNRITNNT